MALWTEVVTGHDWAWGQSQVEWVGFTPNDRGWDTLNLCWPVMLLAPEAIDGQVRRRLVLNLSTILPQAYVSEEAAFA